MEKFDIYLIVSLLIFFGILLTVINFIFYKKLLKIDKEYKDYNDNVDIKLITYEDNINQSITNIKTELHSLEHKLNIKNLDDTTNLISDLRNLFDEKIKEFESPHL
jgi:hypothetical protein